MKGDGMIQAYYSGLLKDGSYDVEKAVKALYGATDSGAADRVLEPNSLINLINAALNGEDVLDRLVEALVAVMVLSLGAGDADSIDASLREKIAGGVIGYTTAINNTGWMSRNALFLLNTDGPDKQDDETDSTWPDTFSFKNDKPSFLLHVRSSVFSTIDNPFQMLFVLKGPMRVYYRSTMSDGETWNNWQLISKIAESASSDGGLNDNYFNKTLQATGVAQSGVKYYRFAEPTETKTVSNVNWDKAYTRISEQTLSGGATVINYKRETPMTYTSGDLYEIDLEDVTDTSTISNSDPAWAISGADSGIKIKNVIAAVASQTGTNKITLAQVYAAAYYKFSLAPGEGAVVSGKNTLATGAHSFAAGEGCIAVGDNQTVIGRYNVPVPDALFVVGNGTDDEHRHNTFLVDADGNAMGDGKRFAAEDDVNERLAAARQDYISMYGMEVSAEWEPGSINADGKLTDPSGSSWIRTKDYIELSADGTVVACALNDKRIVNQVFYYTKNGSTYDPAGFEVGVRTVARTLDPPAGATHFKIRATTSDWETSGGIPAYGIDKYANRIWICYSYHSTYKQLHDAISAVDQDLQEDKRELDDAMTNIAEYNILDVVHLDGVFENKTHGGVNYTWNDRVCTAAGDTHGYSMSFCNIIFSSSSIPFGIKKGKTYRITANSSAPSNLFLELFIYKEGAAEAVSMYILDSSVIEVTDDMIGLVLRIRARNNSAIAGTIAPTMVVEPESDLRIDNLIEHNRYDVIKSVKRTDRTSGGVSYAWDGFKCHVSGTKTGSYSFCNIVESITTLPSGFVGGKRYLIKTNGINAKVLSDLFIYRNGSTSGVSVSTADDLYVTLPSDTTGILFRLRVADDGAVDETVQPEIISILDDAEESGNKYAKMFVKVNSLMVGSVWKLNTETGTVKHHHHPSAWGNSPYSVIAQKLGIREDGLNTDILHSSTGFLYAPPAPSTGEPTTVGSFLDNIMGNAALGIEAPDLTDYDYLLTMFFGWDLKNYLLDTTETHDGYTIKEGVLALVDYLNTNYPWCRLVLVSAPPADVNMRADGSVDPFSYAYRYKSTDIYQTIAQLDTMLHQLAKEHGFVYIDYQGWAFSRFWQRCTGGYYNGAKINNVHFNNEDAYRRCGQYLAEHV